MKLDRIVQTLDELAPLRYAESWDNVGLLVGDPAADVGRVLVTVDYSPAVAEEARAKQASLVVSYHPPLFAAVKRAVHGVPWVEAIRLGIALYSPHTALDVAPLGTNDFLADACGIHVRGRAPLRPFGTTSGQKEPDGIGLGRAGDVAPITLGELVERCKRTLGLDHVLVAGPLERVIHRVGVAAGAGGELLGDAVRANVDVFVTGELRHHDALSALARGVCVVAALHSNSERAAVRAYSERLAGRLVGVDVVVSEYDADPLRIV